MKRKRRVVLISLSLLLLVSAVVSQAAGLLDPVMLKLEQEIGANTYQEITAKNKVIKLPAAQAAKIDAIFAKILKVSIRQKEIKYNLTIIDDKTVNAFALPAGYIFLQTGLLNFTSREGEIAGVIAHEFAHIEKRHSMQALGRAIGLSYLLAIATSRSGAARKDQMAKIGSVAINLTMLGYSRDAEYEADKVGVQLMQKAGYNKADMASFLAKIDKAAGGGKEPAFLQYFSTHPPLAERVKKIEAMP